MKGCVDIFRWGLGIFASIILLLFLLITPILISTSLFITNKEGIKAIIENSEIYDNLDEIFIEQLSIQAEILPTDEYPGEENSQQNPDMTKLFESIVTPEFAKETIEQAIDNLYAFLNGETDSLSLSFETQQIKDIYLEVLTSMVKDQLTELEEGISLEDLPVCDFEVKEGEEFSIDLEDPCIPSNINFDEGFETAIAEIDPNFTAQSESFNIVPKEINQNFDAETFQLGFKIVKNLPLLLLGIIFIFTFLTVLIIPGIKTGLIYTGIVGVIPSLANIAIFTLFRLSPKILQTQLTTISTNGLNLIDSIPVELNDAVFEILERLTSISQYVAIGLFILFMAIIVIGIVVKKRPSPKVSELSLKEDPLAQQQTTSINPVV